MDNWKTEPDFSWMSFNPEAHGIKPRLSVWPSKQNSSGQDKQQQRSGDGGSWRGATSERSDSEYQKWGGESEIVEEEKEAESRRLRSRAWGKEQGRKMSEDFDDDRASSSSVDTPVKAARPIKFQWDGAQGGGPYAVAPRPPGRGIQSRVMQSLDEDDNVITKTLPKSSSESKYFYYPGIQFAARVASIFCLLALIISMFLLYLSFGVTARPPSACEVDKVVLNFTAPRIRLKGGRYISFREQGVAADKAQHSLLVVHDLVSSRLAGIPGISASLLEEFGVRLVCYDRPGYGQSDLHLGRSYYSSAQDMADIADALGMGEKFWVAGFGNGGPHVWAAINYIPERLAGVALFAPAGNFYAENMTKEEVAETWEVLTLRQKWMYSIARHFPALLPALLQKTLVNDNPSPLRTMGASLGSKDQRLMEQDNILSFWKDDAREALQQQCAFPMTEELILLVDKWGFSLGDLPLYDRDVKTLLQQVVGLFQAKEKAKIFSGPIHIWQGMDDPHVPAVINQYAMRMIHRNGFPQKTPSPVTLHPLEGEGHMSWFWFCDKCHRTVFNALFQGSKEKSPSPDVRQGFSAEEFEAILAAFGGPKDGDKNDLLDRHVDSEDEADLSTGMMVYVPDSCQAPMDLTTSIFRSIEDKVRKYIR